MKIFICFPLGHADAEVVKERIRRTTEYCLELTKQGHVPFSPALMGLTMLNVLPENERDVTFAVWEEFCYAYLEPADEVHVLQLNGWAISKGVAGEVNKAKEWGKPIEYIPM